MTSTEPRLRDDGMCFGCGPYNPIGLRLNFWWDGDLYTTRYTPEQNHQGWVGRTHGGMLALVLDEVLARAALDKYGREWVTAELTTRLAHPALIGSTLLVTGRIETVRTKLIVCVGEARDETSGIIVATGLAKMMRAKQKE